MVEEEGNVYSVCIKQKEKGLCVCVRVQGIEREERVRVRVLRRRVCLSMYTVVTDERVKHLGVERDAT